MKKLILVISFLLFSSTAHATLIDRGGGLIYDDVLDITWMQDAYYAATELTDARRDAIISTVGSVDGHTLTTSDFLKDGSGNYTGTMSWWGAMAWAQSLNFGGFNDWRLPSMDVNGDQIVVEGSVATEVAIRDNEYAYMYYQNLGGNLGDSLEGTQTVNAGTPSEFAFNNIQSGYLSGSVFQLNDNAWHFDFGVGVMFNIDKITAAASWAVRSGDVTPVPEPDISISPTSHDFGNVTVGGTSSSQTFTISNIGDVDLDIIGTISLTGTDVSDFVILFDGCSGLIFAPLATCTIEVLFSPTSPGAKSANLSISSNDPDTPELNVPLSGKGKPSPGSGGGGGGNKERNCTDEIDNDGDGKVDCEDCDCRKDPACSGGGVPEICDDGEDNDCDGKIDCDDKKDCKNDPACP